MKVAVVLFAAVATVHSTAIRAGRQHGPGWSPPGWSSTTTTTPGWTTPPPTTTPGWTTPPPTTVGWSSPPPPPSTPGWSSGKDVTSIDLNAALAASGAGWSAENHAENVAVVGAGGWGGPNADLVISAGGESILAQDGSILQVTSQDSEQASSLNTVEVSQIAAASEGETVDALGLEITNQQSGWAGAAGEGASAAEADSSIVISKKH